MSAKRVSRPRRAFRVTVLGAAGLALIHTACLFIDILPQSISLLSQPSQISYQGIDHVIT
ncbi:hypothetical protein PCANC_00925 [Puccinia coronata f. sp. avenae]|uniref:Uncharacterized protein n=1 Tax=Puccinia coronata f. sp. avenae TaxID=200324 RepID=A0A2N5TFN2_9BASI|nr:hypothetical protein PCASD_06522 [Puccinia coronata f. sp. avenae]PLW49851.1 hypothetical protein PCASD_01525 [Puccinia coronata f. sp. avenae]PLW57802.1 hypothetical protein PCANC_00925 [Puccinia coronata f. sp. avenae]